MSRGDRSYSDDYRPQRGQNLYQPGYMQQYRSYQPDYPVYRREYRTHAQPDRAYDQQSFGRTYDRPQAYSSNNYVDQQNYDNGNQWTQQLIRSVISSFFSTGVDDGYYGDNTYGQSHDSGYGYQSQNNYYELTHNTFGYAPTSSYYEPAAYYGYDEYANEGLPYDTLLGSLPYSDLLDIYSGGMAGEMIQRSLGTGYYQGLLEGQHARQRGWGDEYYSDPYLYGEAIYDPYSTSIGDSRRHFSEGYEMGYEDALRGRDDFDIAEGGEVDLVGLLLGSVLSLRG